MIKKNIKFIISIIMIVFIILIQTHSWAATNSLTMILEPDKTEIESGETVNVLIKVSNIQGEGIIGFNANVVYNSDVFECTANGDDEGTWTKQGFIENNLTTARSDLEASTENQTVAKLTFKAKTDVAIGEQTISISQIEFSTENGTYSVEDVQVKVEIVEESTSGESDNTDNNDKENNTTENNNTSKNNTNENTNTSGIGNKNDTKNGITTSNNSTTANGNLVSSTKTLPKAGMYNFLSIAVFVVAIIAVVCYYQYIKYKNV